MLGIAGWEIIADNGSPALLEWLESGVCDRAAGFCRKPAIIAVSTPG
jgi:hypothetical protein